MCMLRPLVSCRDFGAEQEGERRFARWAVLRSLAFLLASNSAGCFFFGFFCHFLVGLLLVLEQRLHLGLGTAGWGEIDQKNHERPP